jgi:hypothetical protein
MNDLNPVHTQVAASQIYDPLASGNVPVLFVYGGTAGLDPENARSWTLGADWTPQTIPSLKAKLTYYNVSYTDRITNPQLAFSGVVPDTNADPLKYESLLARFITRDPSLALSQEYVANSSVFSDFSNIPGGVNLADIKAIINYSSINLSAVRTSGLDFSLSRAWDLGGASLQAGVDAT